MITILIIILLIVYSINEFYQVNYWISTLYALLYALAMTQKDSFSQKEKLHENILSCAKWVNPVCSFPSPLAAERFGTSKVSFRRDPISHFEENSQNIVKMLIQDLVVILDGMMEDALRELSFTAGITHRAGLRSFTRL